MDEVTGMTTLDMIDVHCKADRVRSRYHHLEQMMDQMYQASDADGDQAELQRPIELIGYEHAECGADLKAILRLVRVKNSQLE